VISIAMATYNGEKYLCEQLDSIMRQTYRDFELIITDDCSTDATLLILSEYQVKYPAAIYYYQNEKRLGYKKNFEKAIMLCKHDLIALADQDDIWTDEHLETLYKGIGSNAVICSHADNITSGGKRTGKSQRADIPYWLEHNYSYLLLSVLFRNFAQGTTMLFRRSLLAVAFPIPDMVLSHDHWIGLIAVLLHKIKYINTVTVLYRRHDNNVTKFHLNVIKRYNRWLYEIASLISQSCLRLGTRISVAQLIVYKSVCYFFLNVNIIRRIKFFFSYYPVIYWDNSIKLFLPRLFYKIILCNRRVFYSGLNNEIYYLILNQGKKIDNSSFCNCLRSIEKHNGKIA
jgi:glycosyltransferase involved in cell wall biosynthesis